MTAPTRDPGPAVPPPPVQAPGGRAWRRAAGAALFLGLVLGCGSGGAQGGAGAAAVRQTPPGPGSSPPGPLSESTLARFGHNPVYKAIMEAYNQQMQALGDERSAYGQNFIEEAPLAQLEPWEGYFTPLRKDAQGRSLSDDFMDGIQRPLIRAEGGGEPGAPLPAAYRELFQLRPAPWHWEPEATRRVSGFVFVGRKQPPAALAQAGGIRSNLFSQKRPGRDRPEFLALMEQGGDLDTAFNLSWHIRGGLGVTGFVSLSRSVNVARFYCLNIGAVGKEADEGYVYVARVSEALDAGQRRLASMWTREQEVAVPGLVPWGQVVAYRKFVRHPGPPDHPGPPEFTGPIHVRSGLKALEPRAHDRILQALSRKSRFTQDFEAGRAWQDHLPRQVDEAYLAGFHAGHPQVDPDAPAIWGGP